MGEGLSWPLTVALYVRDVLKLPAAAAADSAFAGYFGRFQVNLRVEGSVATKLVRSIEKGLGHRAAPFNLNIRVLPVEGFWLHRSGPTQVLISESARWHPAKCRLAQSRKGARVRPVRISPVDARQVQPAPFESDCRYAAADAFAASPPHNFP